MKTIWHTFCIFPSRKLPGSWWLRRKRLSGKRRKEKSLPLKGGGMIKTGRYVKLQEVPKMKYYIVIPAFRGRQGCAVRVKGMMHSFVKGFCCLFFSCFLSLLEPPPWLDALWLQPQARQALGFVLEGWCWVSQHLVASLRHYQSSWCRTIPLLQSSV